MIDLKKHKQYIKIVKSLVEILLLLIIGSLFFYTIKAHALTSADLPPNETGYVNMYMPPLDTRLDWNYSGVIDFAHMSPDSQAGLLSYAQNQFATKNTNNRDSYMVLIDNSKANNYYVWFHIIFYNKNDIHLISYNQGNVELESNNGMDIGYQGYWQLDTKTLNRNVSFYYNVKASSTYTKIGGHQMQRRIIYDSNNTKEIELKAVSGISPNPTAPNYPIKKCQVNPNKCSDPWTIGDKVPMSVFSEDYYTPVSWVRSVDMSHKHGVLFYYNNLQTIKQQNEEFTINGFYSLCSAIVNRTTENEITSYKLTADTCTDYESIDNLVENEKVIGLSNNTNPFVHFNFTNTAYSFINKTQDFLTGLYVKYDSSRFNYSYINVDGTLETPITFIDENGDEQTINETPKFTTGDANNSLLNLTKFNTDTHGLTSIISAPLNLINSLTTSTCTPINMPIPFVNDNITLPCMYQVYQDNFGSVFSTYQLIVFGLIAYWVIVQFLNMIKDFKNPNNDKIEVVDL